MGIAFADIVQDLKDVVQQDGTVPVQRQYEAAVRTAVAAFNAKRGYQRRTTLAMVSGTSTYTLPTDFFDIIRWEPLGFYADDDGTIITSAGIHPQSTWSWERFEVINRQITFYPTPQFTGDRYLWYRAGHVLDENDEYPNMRDEDVDLILIKAQAEIWRFIAAEVSAGFSYRYANVAVDKKAQGKPYMDIAVARDNQFVEMLKCDTGPRASQLSEKDYPTVDVRRLFM